MLILFFLIVFGNMPISTAKYITQESFNVAFSFDKTSPIIYLESGETRECFEKTLTEQIDKTENIIINTTDNVEIKSNQYYFNPSLLQFDCIEPKQFENEQEFTEEGYYKIVATDTSGNTTQIVIRIDKSPPEIKVQYFKKGQQMAKVVKQIAGRNNNWLTESVLELTEQTNEDEFDIQNEMLHESINEIEETTNEELIEPEQEENEERNVISHKEETEEELKQEEFEEKATGEIIEKVTTEAFKEEIFGENAEELESTHASESEIMVMSGDFYVGNEAEFRNALANQASTIHIRQSIDFTAPLFINYAVTVTTAGSANSLRYAYQGDFIVVQNGGSLTVNAIVIDTKSSGVSGMNALHIQSGGVATFLNSSIIDGGLGNTGALINTGGTLVLQSCEIVHSGYGINLQTNGNLIFQTQAGRCNNFYENGTAIFIDNFYGTCYFNQNICIRNNINYGIYISNSRGNIHFSAGNYYENTYCIRTCNITGGNVTVSGGNYYSNGWAIWVGGNLNLTGGMIYNNYYGVLTDASYSGNFQMTGGNIFANTANSISHHKVNDGGCTITGGSISGEIYLAQKDNYINTNSSYPRFIVTPSSYYFKRKLIRSSNHNVANTEIANVELTPRSPWYKYVYEEYIVLWSGSNVVVRCKDYEGNLLKQEVLNGTIGASYSVTPPTISGYDLISIPSNIKGNYTQNDIFVDLNYDLVNVAQVSFEDSLSGVTSAKYWYNANSENFTGNGTDFASGAVFEKYGFYKIVIRNGVGLPKEVQFVLDKNSIIR